MGDPSRYKRTHPTVALGMVPAESYSAIGDDLKLMADLWAKLQPAKAEANQGRFWQFPGPVADQILRAISRVNGEIHGAMRAGKPWRKGGSDTPGTPTKAALIESAKNLQSERDAAKAEIARMQAQLDALLKGKGGKRK